MNLKSILILSVLLASWGCELRANRTAPESRTQRVPVSLLKPIEAPVHEASGRVVQVMETRIPTQAGVDDQIRQALFVDELHGWASTSESLFSTTDAGESWRRLSFKAPTDSRIASFFFVDETRGWLVVTKQIHTERYGLGNSSQLLATTDGGNTWKEQASLADEVTINEIRFFNANEGLAVGARTIDQPREQGPPYEQIAAWKTTNGGEVWTEISDFLRTTLKNETNSDNDSGRSIRWLSSAEILLLTKYGRILNTSDQGATWQATASLKDERPQGEVSSVGYYKLMLNPEQKINVIAGAMGNEGYWGNFVVNGDDKSWTSYELTLRPIFDGMFLSKDEILACGMDMKSDGEKQKPTTRGVILHSLDHGRSWTTVYRSNAREAFISLSNVGNNRFYAVSDTGTVLSFELHPKT